MVTKRDKIIFSENLQRLMKNKNIDQKELAETIGVSQPTISNWVKEIKYPKVKTLKRLADYFNIPQFELTKKYNNKIATYIDYDFTEDEIKEIVNFIEYVKSKRNTISNK
ncbi:helix-turn-helix domain-containing protein [Staphylococcus petrasii]|uniref:helix-turn-helix domain-containing protein n=1 Tax=Staphylococcus petrasii TaxID=1276936 RepID=UPI001F594A29|nr:helix-turn-helix transcriptional regulator [Staphylococcus petrasii]MCI2773599.1 helix-turn-helix domain-containing protein [Staphylococcus petrasii]